MSGEESLKELFKVGPFGGIDLTTDPDKINPTLAMDTANIAPYRTYGQAVAAKGRSSGALNAGSAITNFFPFQSSTSLAFLGAGGGLATGPLGGSITSVTMPTGASYTPGKKIRCDVYGGQIYVTDGGDQPIKISQSAITVATNWGINPPTGAITVAVGAGTNLTGQYYWCYTYLNSTTQQESSHSPISQLLVLAAQAGSIPVVASTDTQVTNINLYRLGGTNSTWTLAQTAANTTATLNDNVADTALIGNTLTLHQDPPANFRTVCMHKDRAWGFGYDQAYPFTFTAANQYTSTPAQPSDLWFSNYATPGAFDCVNSVLPIGRNSFGDTAVGLCSNGSLLFVFKNYTTWLIFGDSEQDFRPVPALTIGAVSQELICSAYGLAFWVSPDGNIWMWDGQTAPVNISEGDPEHGGIQAAMNAQNGSFVGWSMAAFNRVVYVSTGINGPTYGFYLKTQTWHKHNYGTKWLASIPQFPWIGGISPAGTTLDNWFGQEGDAYLNPYNPYWVSGVLHMGRSSARKSLRHVILKIPPGDSVNNSLKVTFTIDGTVFPSLPVLVPRTLVGSSGQGVGGWYYRLSLGKGYVGYSITIRLDFTSGPIPMAVSELSVFGDYTDDFQPQNVALTGGGT